MKPSHSFQTINFGGARLMCRLAHSGSGRVALHILCLVRNPRRLHWHCRGILRELFHIAGSCAAEPASTHAVKGGLA